MGLLKDVIPEVELTSSQIDRLEERYLRDDAEYRIWFEYLIPDEIDIIFPTTDSKLNYLSFTRRLASGIRYNTARNTLRDDGAKNTFGQTMQVCEHGAALNGRSERFASVINRFLDLHQILKDC